MEFPLSRVVLGKGERAFLGCNARLAGHEQIAFHDEPVHLSRRHHAAGGIVCIAILPIIADTAEVFGKADAVVLGAGL